MNRGLVAPCLTPVLAVAAAAANAGECVISDNFADGNPAPMWAFETRTASVMNILEQNSRVEFRAATANPGTEAIAIGYSTGWKIDMTTDWMASARWHITPPTPNVGDVGISFICVLEGDPESLYFHDGFTVNGGVANLGQGVDVYESTRIYSNGSFSSPTSDDRSYTEDVVYIWYDASSGCFSYSDVPNDPGAVTVCGIDDLSSQTVAWIGFAGYNFGAVPAFGGSNLWVDTFCLEYGSIVGADVGACCFSDTCVETLEDACQGEWLGAGTSCGFACEPTGACCFGDGCMTVAAEECVFAQGTWLGAGSDCDACGCEVTCDLDIDGDGSVGFTDLIALLAAWGPCGGPGVVEFIEPGGSPYLSFLDSPFDSGISCLDYFWLEDFEDGLFNTPGVSVGTGNVREPGGGTDSVDVDADGVIDGLGTSGYDYFEQNSEGAVFEFVFDDGVLGSLPTQAGIVWTDGNDAATVTFEAFGPGGGSVGSFDADLGDGEHGGSTAADRFLGVRASSGLSSIRISASLGSMEVDHLQYGGGSTCALDLDQDGAVGFTDLIAILSAWGPCP